MRNSLILLITFAVMACSSKQEETTGNETGVNFQQINVSEIFAQAKKQQKLVMIDVYSDG